MWAWSSLVGLLVLAPPLAGQGRLVVDSLRSPALENNRLGDSPTRRFLIYLPPGYANEDGRRFPSVYLLHAFGGSPGSWIDGSYQGFDIRQAMDSLIGTGALREFVVVMPDGSNSLGASVFTNSTTTGGWETYLVRDLVRYVDARYRTIRRGTSRGIAGHSMGAGAALRLAMRFPGIFAAVYGMSPNALRPCLALSEPEVDTLLGLSRRSTWDSLGFASQLCLGYAAAWSPDSTRPPFYADLPFTRGPAGIVPDSAVLVRWAAWQLLDMASRYREGLVRLRGVAFDVGRADDYYSGVATLDSLLTRLRVRHTFESYRGDHSDRVRDRLTAHLLPYFSATLDFGPEGM
jgi:enterochelin esterase-like enzyme